MRRSGGHAVTIRDGGRELRANTCRSDADTERTGPRGHTDIASSDARANCHADASAHCGAGADPDARADAGGSDPK